MKEFEIGLHLGADRIRDGFDWFLGQFIRENIDQLDAIRNKAERINSTNPNHTEALFIMALAAKIAGSEQEYFAAWNRLSECNPDESHAVRCMASALMSAEFFRLAIEWTRLWLESSPTDSALYEIGAISSKLSGDYEAFVAFIDDARKNLTSPIHVPTTALPGSDVVQQHTRIKSIVSPNGRAPVGESDGLTFARQYFADMDWADFNPKGLTVHAANNVGAIKPPGNQIPALRLTAPYSQDRNHERGIGFINTVGGWDVSQFIDDYGLLSKLANTSGNRIDISGGEIRLRLRPVSLNAKDFHLTLFCQTLVDSSDDGTHFIAAWVLTGNSVDCGDLEDGEWQIISFRIESDPDYWETAGDNPKTNTLKWRYIEAPLEQALILNETTFGLCFTGGTWPEIPEGAIELHYIELGIPNCRR